MDEGELERLLNRVAGSPEGIPPEVKEVFSTLVQSTLDFRDRQLEEVGVTVTVEDVRIALDWLLDFFRSGRMPRTNHQVRRALFETWVAALNAPGK
jgi:hypothetical protein